MCLVSVSTVNVLGPLVMYVESSMTSLTTSQSYSISQLLPAGANSNCLCSGVSVESVSPSYVAVSPRLSNFATTAKQPPPAISSERS